MRSRIVLVALLAAGAAPTAHADWSGRGELGLVLARGNWNTTSFHGNVEVTREVARWTHEFAADVLRTRNDGVTSADRFELQGASQYAFGPRAFAWSGLRHEADRNSEFEYQTTLTAGPGWTVLDTDTSAIVVRIGAGWRRAEIRTSGFREEDPVGRGDLYLEHRFRPGTVLRNEFLVESGGTNTYLQNELALEVAMTERLALGVAYTLRRNSAVSPGVLRTDQLTTATLVLTF